MNLGYQHKKFLFDFFFQAEDGIRDYKVTGVQTCALPILTAVAGVATFSGLSVDKVGTGYTLTAAATGLTTGSSTVFNVTPGAARSEERRVGKECRSRWSACH